ncbi:ATP-dependent Clp protease proteolytic subunit [Actinomadura craniellae]|uniref:ATP-dependent Clp protease proteolytic subunit n=1 Tax=Actinomadura craniellae TaxID=2231787 RepID=A0A365H511_9ACTN|nr:ATP-dependent Clp protease proteolytic subunit [Actinomadura craniellae]RAY14181.1 ATP-dependent Clp protease proteolytic subunit [Actinomadura craniellae]
MYPGTHPEHLPARPDARPAPPGTHAPRLRAEVDTLPRLQQDALDQRLLAQRIVFLGAEIDDALANRICGQLLLLSAQDGHRDVTLYINSPGGSVDAGMAIYDVMQYLPNDVATVALGLAASMGQSLLCAGTPGKRYALRHARVMMHQPSGGIGGTASDIKIQIEQALYLKQILAERTAQHTGQPLERIKADSDRDRWFTAEEARDYGLVDHVVDSTDRVGDT